MLDVSWRGAVRRYWWWFTACVLVAACGRSTAPAGAPADPASRQAPSTPGSTTLAPSSTVGERSEAWLAVLRRDFPGYVFEFVDIASGTSMTLDANRYAPHVSTLFGDLRGGLVVSPGLTRLEAESMRPVSVGPDGAELDLVTLVEGQPTALYRVHSGTSSWDGDVLHQDTLVELYAWDFTSVPQLLESVETATSVDYATGEGEQTGSRLADVGYGGGVLALVWTSDLSECAWLELREGFSDRPAGVVNPWPDPRCDDIEGGLLSVAVSADGSALVAHVYPSIRPEIGSPDLVAWDLATGDEIDRLPGTLVWVYDGDRTFVVDRRAGTDVETVAAFLTDEGFRIASLAGVKGGVLGIVRGSLLLADDATLTPEPVWPSCSAATLSLPTADDLPAAVVSTRDAIARAAIACDLVALADLAIAAADFRMVDGDVTCDEPWPMSLQDDDVVPYWYRVEVDHAELAVIVDALVGRPDIVEGRYVWTGADGYRIEIGADGGWLLNWRSFPQPPCKHMGCTC